MALEGGEVNAGNEVYYLPVGLYSTQVCPLNMIALLTRSCADKKERDP